MVFTYILCIDSCVYSSLIDGFLRSERSIASAEQEHITMEFTLLVPHYQDRLIQEIEGPYLATFTKLRGATSIKFSCLRYNFSKQGLQTDWEPTPAPSRCLEDPSVVRVIGELLDVADNNSKPEISDNSNQHINKSTEVEVYDSKL
jgi:hypothetical protein